MVSTDNSDRIDVVFSPEQIKQRIDALSATIAAAPCQRLLVIAILKGSFVFAADLIRSLHQVGLAPEVDFITLSSYKERMKSSGFVEILRDVETDVKDRDVLLVDDILESGRTLAFAKDLLVARGANSVMTCVLLDKPGKRAVAIKADHCAFTCPDVFVVGYGMDLAHRYRELPYVGQIVQKS